MTGNKPHVNPQGIKVALASDSISSNPDLDLCTGRLATMVTVVIVCWMKDEREGLAVGKYSSRLGVLTATTIPQIPEM